MEYEGHELADGYHPDDSCHVSTTPEPPTGTLPPGAILVYDIITEEEERQILKSLEDHGINKQNADSKAPVIPNDESKQQVEWVMLAHRRVAHFGYKFNYTARSYDDEPTVPIPDWGVAVMAKIQVVMREYRNQVQYDADINSESGLPTRHVLGRRIQGEERQDTRIPKDDIDYVTKDAPAFDQLTVNEYRCGVGLRSHVDTHSAFSGAIVSVALGSGCIFEYRTTFYRRPKQRMGQSVSDQVLQTDWKSHSVYVPRRSLMIMSSEARYAWMHYIPLRKYDVDDLGNLTKRGTRVSLTFRNIRRNRSCSCGWETYCDSQRRSRDQTDEPKHDAMVADDTDLDLLDLKLLQLGEGFENRFVRQTYDAIAPHFDDTRHGVFWPRVRRFLSLMPRNSTLLDIGTANGKYLHIGSHSMKFGIDPSPALLKLANDHGKNATYEFAAALGEQLPFRTSLFDGCICVSVLHHISTHEMRLRAVREMARVMAVGGKGLIYVWALEQEHPEKTLNRWTLLPFSETSLPDTQSAFAAPNGNDAESHSIETDHVDKHHCKKPNLTEKYTGDFQDPCIGKDYLVPWYLHPGVREDWRQRAKELGGVWDETRRAIKLYRYYHLFQGNELRKLLSLVSGIQIVDYFYEHSNWGIVFEKKEEATK